MAQDLNRRQFIKGSLLASATGALAAGVGAGKAAAEDAPKPPPAAANALPLGKIGKLQVSRVLLGGNLLSHYTHSRDLNYVYALAAHYNTEAKILETLAIAEQNGINTMSMHNPDLPMKLLMQHRKQGGKIQWIICPTANIDASMKDHEFQVKVLVQDQGADAIYIWGVRSDPLAASGQVGLIAKAVEAAKKLNVPCGVGCHDLKVVVECEKAQVPCDFYIKTFHHHNYPSAPRPDQVKAPLSEVPGYWCSDPKGTAEFMKTVEKPWIAFKTMAAGAIPPEKAIKYCFENGADHVLLGMFDFEIAHDAKVAKKALDDLKDATRARAWRS
ncbi:MAG: twin-arginine translocation signal domain-containing protein [Planctomycetota bacterium]|nr:twin-arginine translocation signal domain-containing protein [Planctomycetota bacterium]